MRVEGMSKIFADCPSFDMYLPETKIFAKPVPFWYIKPTQVEAEANMELIWVAVSVGVSTVLEGELNKTISGELLRSYITPESTVKVTLPVYVNHRLLEFGDQLRFYKPPETTDGKKRKVQVADDLADFVKSCAEARKRPKARR